MNRDDWVTEDMPENRPSTARMYDYLLGGYHNFEVDRAFAEKMLQLFPTLRQTAQVTRSFLRRVVQFVAGQGIDQFLDIGSGLPTMGNVHQIVQAVNPAARIVYVDIDPIAVAHGRAILAENPTATSIQGDLRRPDDILGHPAVTELLDMGRPIAVLLVAVLHFVTDDDLAYAVVERLRRAMAPGSYLVILHGIPEKPPEGDQTTVGRAYRPVSETRNRSPEEILAFFAGLDLLEPGLVLTPLWRPEGPDDVWLATPELGLTMSGMGRKP